MKTNKLFIGAFALLLAGLASCSDEEPIGAATSTPQAVSTDGNKYMSVVLSTSGDDGSRAVGQPEFIGGVGNECGFSARDVIFLFYDEYDNPFPLAADNVYGETTSNAVAPQEIDTVHGPGNATMLRAALVLGKPVGEGYVGRTPAKALCVINNEGRFSLNDVANHSLETVINFTAQLPKEGLDGATSKFLMTSAVYADGENVVQAVPLDGYFFDNYDQSIANPVKIYVERVVAKVCVQGLAEYDVQKKDQNGKAKKSKYSVDNDSVNLKVELTHWGIRNTASSNYIIKHIDANGNYFTGWNDSDRHRCYWTLPQNTTTVQNGEYDIYNKDSEYALPRGNWTGKDDVTNVEYCLENTRQPASATDRSSLATGIVVRGVVKMQDENDEWKRVDLIRWAGAYYTLPEFKKIVANSYEISNKVDIDTSMVQLRRPEQIQGQPAPNGNYWQAVIVLPSGATERMDNFNNLLWWQNGITSYYTNIEHTPGSTTDRKLFGVVRNHVYKYVFDGVVGLGIPGNTPNVPDETETFLSAQIYCLNWRVINNTVTLE